MIRIILAVSAIAILIYMLSLHWKAEKQSVPLPSTVKIRTDNHLIDSLRHQLQTTIDSLNSYKPAIEKAIQKLKFYDSIYSHSKSPDTIWMKQMRSDLYEARLEIRRLCYLGYFKSSQ